MKKPTRHMFSFLRMMNEGYNAHVHFQPNILSPNRTSKCGCGFSMGTVDGLIARKLIEERSSRAAKNRHGVFKLTPTGRKLV
ncbi:hypothetical protein KAR91_01245, partial [Candidatus Pacearchaeota archaeon]|nr:hypothetical protein [Candidatus Pacearchaeota archaeon]